MEDFIALIANVGFPIVITSYLLVRMENKMDKLTIAINDLAHHLDNSTKKIN
ncbi:YvrJ family protein [Clostridium tarantellae]|uniref:YvrJ family protein n=1 Tax=Clostridium tarantellae TaxID=39493 RepID=A0A6I1MNZ5_9CLOT|nr:YvrJ family protein [Clostridium tarantellae]MPQ44198.1 YvrJ family protein [Clostridium tarantellae]